MKIAIFQGLFGVHEPQPAIPSIAREIDQRRDDYRGRLRLNDGSCIRLRPEYRNHVWSYSFVSARTHVGRGLRILTLIDEARRQCFAIVVARRHNNRNAIETLADATLILSVPHHSPSANVLNARAIVQVGNSIPSSRKRLDLIENQHTKVKEPPATWQFERLVLNLYPNSDHFAIDYSNLSPFDVESILTRETVHI